MNTQMTRLKVITTGSSPLGDVFSNIIEHI